MRWSGAPLPPLPVNLEPVREVDGVLGISDSGATNVASTVVAVEAMDRPFVLLLGGRHKGEPYTRLGPLLKERCRLVIAYGESGQLGGRGPRGPGPLGRGTTFPGAGAPAPRAGPAGDPVCASPAGATSDIA